VELAAISASMRLNASTRPSISRVSADGARSRQSRRSTTSCATSATREIGCVMRRCTRPVTHSASPSDTAITSAWMTA